MDIILIAFICALGYFIICYKLFGAKLMISLQVILDIIVTLGLPCLFLGTFSGMATAFLAGVFFSIMTAILTCLHNDDRPDSFTRRL
jgi:hypothetical protein